MHAIVIENAAETPNIDNIERVAHKRLAKVMDMEDELRTARKYVFPPCAYP